MIYNNAIRSIRTEKYVILMKNIIMIQCRTTNSKYLRRLESRNKYIKNKILDR